MALKVVDKDLDNLAAKGYSTVDGSVIGLPAPFSYRPLENVRELVRAP